MSVKLRMELERRIARAALKSLIEAGFSITINDDEFGNGEDVIKRSQDLRAILAAMFSTDGDLIIVHNTQGKRFAWVSLIYGNSGHDVIHDHTTNISQYLLAANEIADQYA